MRGVPLLMYSPISSSSPPKVSRDNTGPYCRVRCWTTVWQTPQDWLKRRNPSRWGSLNDGSGGAPCAKARDVDATTNAAAKTPRGICRSSDYLQPSHELDCGNLTPWGGGVERGRGAVDTRELGNARAPSVGSSPGLTGRSRADPGHIERPLRSHGRACPGLSRPSTSCSRIPVILKRRKVSKANRAHHRRAPVGTARTKVGLARLWHIQSLSKSATADFDERAFAHPTSDSSRSESALTGRSRRRHEGVIPSQHHPVPIPA